MKQTNKNLH